MNPAPQSLSDADLLATVRRLSDRCNEATAELVLHLKVQFTADKVWVDKLREAQALLSHRLPDGDVSAVLDQALTLLCERLRKERFGAGTAQSAPPPDAREPGSVDATDPEPTERSRHIPNEIKRQVVLRNPPHRRHGDGDPGPVHVRRP